MRSNEGGGAYRWADEGGQQGGCPTSTSSERERENRTGRLSVGGSTERSYRHRNVLTLDGDDSAGADSGRLRGGTGGGTGTSSEPRLKLIMEETEDDPESRENQLEPRNTNDTLWSVY